VTRITTAIGLEERSSPTKLVLQDMRMQVSLVISPTIDQTLNAICSGYTNITTSDGIVHGQVKQAGKFSFIRIYESGHEVPFYQPVVALEMFERAVAGLDIATGKTEVGAGYLTVGTAKSTYREGNGTIQTVPVPISATYNTTTNMPNPFNATEAASKEVSGVWGGEEDERG
jgi:hypothetical protein